MALRLRCRSGLRAKSPMDVVGVRDPGMMPSALMSVASPAVSGARTCSNNSLSDEEILESSEGGEIQLR